MDTVIKCTPNADISKNHFLNKTQIFLYLGFKFSCVLKHVALYLKSEFGKSLGKKSSFYAKVTFCYFCIPSEELIHL